MFSDVGDLGRVPGDQTKITRKFHLPHNCWTKKTNRLDFVFFPDYMFSLTPAQRTLLNFFQGVCCTETRIPSQFINIAVIQIVESCSVC